MHSIDKQTVGVVLLAVSVVIAALSPELSGMLAPIALPALFIVICFTLISFADRPRAELLSVDKTSWMIVGWQQVVVPSIVIAFGILLDLNPDLIMLMLVSACASSLFAAPMLAGFLSLDRKMALQGMVLSTICMPFSLYAFFSILHEMHVAIDMVEYIHRTTVFLVIPFALLWFYRLFLVRMPAKVVTNVASVSRWGALVALIVFGIGIMHPVALQIYDNPLIIVFYLGIVTALSIGMYLLTAIVMHRFGTTEAATAGMLSGFRNIGLCMALVGDRVGSDFGIYVGVSMLPIFLAPAVIHFMMIEKSNNEPILAS